MYHALAENIGITPASNLVPLSARQWNAIRMAFRWRADSGTILHAYWEVGGQWTK